MYINCDLIFVSKIYGKLFINSFKVIIYLRKVLKSRVKINYINAKIRHI